MKDNNDAVIEETFNGEVEVEEEHSSSGVVQYQHQETGHLDSDFKIARDNIMTLVGDGNKALAGVLDLALASDSPRAYEVVGQLLKILSDTNNGLIGLQHQMADIRRKTDENSTRSSGQREASGGTNIKNAAFFVGSTADLQRLLAKATKEKIEEKVVKNLE